MMRQDPTSWQLGHEHGLKGHSSRCPLAADTLAYADGFLEGRAARNRGIAGGIGLSNDGTLNVVQKGSPKFEPVILPDDDDEDDISDLDDEIE